jgi:hypothetical protein
VRALRARHYNSWLRLSRRSGCFVGKREVIRIPSGLLVHSTRLVNSDPQVLAKAVPPRFAREGCAQGTPRSSFRHCGWGGIGPDAHASARSGSMSVDFRGPPWPRARRSDSNSNGLCPRLYSQAKQTSQVLSVLRHCFFASPHLGGLDSHPPKSGALSASDPRG